MPTVRTPLLLAGQNPPPGSRAVTSREHSRSRARTGLVQIRPAPRAAEEQPRRSRSSSGPVYRVWSGCGRPRLDLQDRFRTARRKSAERRRPTARTRVASAVASPGPDPHPPVGAVSLPDGAPRDSRRGRRQAHTGRAHQRRHSESASAGRRWRRGAGVSEAPRYSAVLVTGLRLPGRPGSSRRACAASS